MKSIEIYKRVLEILNEDTTDPSLGIELRKSQLETIAEIITDEVVNILAESRQELIESIEKVLEK